MNRLTRDGTAEPVSRDQILRHARGQGKCYFPCSADHEQDWQPYPVDPYSAICDDHTYILISPVGVCVMCFLPIHSGHQVRWTYQPGHTGGRSHRIFHPPSFCDTCLKFSREKDSAIPSPRRP